MEKESIDRLKKFTQQLVDLGSLQLEVQISVMEGEVLVDLNGPDADTLLADNARALYAFNHLINQAFLLCLGGLRSPCDRAHSLIGVSLIDGRAKSFVVALLYSREFTF